MLTRRIRLLADTAARFGPQVWNLHRRPRYPNNGARGERVSGSKATAQTVREIRRAYAEGEPQPKIAERYGITKQAVSLIVRRQTWRDLADSTADGDAPSKPA